MTDAYSTPDAGIAYGTSSDPGYPPVALPSLGETPKTPLRITINAKPPDNYLADWQNRIAGIESGGRYDIVGPQTSSGDHAYGKYQVMGANIPDWTEQALGVRMTPQQFLQNEAAQDATFNHKFGDYASKYGPTGAAKAWFAGEGGMNNPDARDALGTSVSDYAARFNGGSAQPNLTPVDHDPFAQGQVTPQNAQLWVTAVNYDPFSGVQYPTENQPQQADPNAVPGQLSRTTNSLLGVNGQERYQTWPERLVRSGGGLPHDVVTGSEPIIDPATGHTAENVIQRSQDTAGLAVLGPAPLAIRAGLAKDTLGSYAGAHDMSAPTKLAGGKVTADIVPNPSGGAGIYEWSSSDRGQGNTIAALQELREKYGSPISVHDIGESGSESNSYWTEMQRRGHVDHLLDAYGMPVSPSAPPFYSAVEQAIQNVKPEKAPGDQWSGILRNSKGVTPDEIKWLGVEDWLKDQKGQVTKQQLLDYVRSNKIDVQTKTLGGGDDLENMTPQQRQDFDNQVAERINALHDEWAMEKAKEAAANDMHGIKMPSHDVEQNADGKWRYTLSDGTKSPWVYSSADSARGKGSWAAMAKHSELADEKKWDHFQRFSEDAWNNEEHGGSGVDEAHIQAEILREMGHSDGGTKWKDYTLPGGSNYQEHLLKLPERNVEHPGDWDTTGWRVKTDKNNEFTGQRDIKIIDKNGETISQRFGFRGSDEQAIRELKTDREVNAITEAKKAANYKSPHWSEPNILAHVRTTDRIIGGKKTLLIEELQSDWHQQGREHGYRVPEVELAADRQRLSELKAQLDAKHNSLTKAAGFEDTKDYWKIYNHPSEPAYDEALTAGKFTKLRKLSSADDEYNRLRAATSELDNKLDDAKHYHVPDAPFKTSWPELAVKRMIRHASENGYDQIAWTPGEVQAERYDLSKQIDSLYYNPKTEHLFARNNDGTPLDQLNVKPDQLADYVGKEAAQKIMETPDRESFVGGEYHKLANADLKIGGEGMKGFYDKILPQSINKLVKKFGGKVEIANMSHPSGPNDERTVTDVHSVQITPQMKQQAMTKGFPLFSAGLPLFRLTPVDHNPFQGSNDSSNQQSGLPRLAPQPGVQGFLPIPKR